MHALFPDLKGKSVFISGGGSGIGAALTEGFLAQGAKVAFVQRSDASAFCEEMEQKTGMRPLFIACDITDIDALKAALDQAASVNGPIDVLVNNAANDQRHKTPDVTEDFWTQNIAINLKHYFFAAQAVLPAMAERGGGVIINLSSISYMMGGDEYPLYTTSNGGITAMTRSLAREFGPKNIRVNGLAPGWVLTKKQRDLWAKPANLAAHIERQCLKMELEAEDMIDPVLFLASEASRAMTGQVMAVDGGVVVSG